jgi:hypothetical protein
MGHTPAAIQAELDARFSRVLAPEDLFKVQHSTAASAASKVPSIGVIVGQAVSIGSETGGSITATASNIAPTPGITAVDVAAGSPSMVRPPLSHPAVKTATLQQSDASLQAASFTTPAAGPVPAVTVVLPTASKTADQGAAEPAQTRAGSPAVTLQFVTNSTDDKQDSGEPVDSKLDVYDSELDAAEEIAHSVNSRATAKTHDAKGDAGEDDDDDTTAADRKEARRAKLQDLEEAKEALKERAKSKPVACPDVGPDGLSDAEDDPGRPLSRRTQRRIEERKSDHASDVRTARK